MSTDCDLCQVQCGLRAIQYIIEALPSDLGVPDWDDALTAIYDAADDALTTKFAHYHSAEDLEEF